MDKSSLEERLSQLLQANNKQFKTAVTFPTDYSGFLKNTNENIKCCFTISIIDDDFSQKTIPPGANELESLDDEIKRIVFKDG